MGAYKAKPLSENWRIKEFVDQCRSIVSEVDEQQITDDQIKGYGQWAIHTMIRTFPVIRDEYMVEIPFVTDYDSYISDPIMSVSTLIRPFNSATARPIKIISSPLPTIDPTLQPNGLYDYHYQHPVNFHILGWWEMRNDLTGSVRRTSDYTQLMGHALNNNTQLSRSSAWFNKGRNLWVSVREGMQRRLPITAPAAGQPTPTADVIHVGIGWRSPLKLIELYKSTAPTGWEDNTDDTDGDESLRYVPEINDWGYMDTPDDYIPIQMQLTSIKMWGQIGKISKEQESASIETAISGFIENSEQQLQNRLMTQKANQWKDTGNQ